MNYHIQNKVCKSKVNNEININNINNINSNNINNNIIILNFPQEFGKEDIKKIFDRFPTLLEDTINKKKKVYLI